MAPRRRAAPHTWMLFESRLLIRMGRLLAFSVGAATSSSARARSLSGSGSLGPGMAAVAVPQSDQKRSWWLEELQCNETATGWANVCKFPQFHEPRRAIEPSWGQAGWRRAVGWVEDERSLGDPFHFIVSNHRIADMIAAPVQHHRHPSPPALGRPSNRLLALRTSAQAKTEDANRAGTLRELLARPGLLLVGRQPPTPPGWLAWLAHPWPRPQLTCASTLIPSFSRAPAATMASALVSSSVRGLTLLS